jgi:hypothetical protein
MTSGQDLFDQLPELPLERFESIGPLERSDRGPFLTVKPPRVEARGLYVPLPDVKKKASHMTRRHFAWAIYPVVVCHDPGPFVDDLQIAAEVPSTSGHGHRDDDGREVRGVEHYRLSALAGRTFPRPLWCTVRHGPWYGRFIEQESCTEGDNEHKWDFYLEGVNAPELGVTTWFGAVTDMPVVPSLSIIWGSLQSENPKYSGCGAGGYPEPVTPPA